MSVSKALCAQPVIKATRIFLVISGKKLCGLSFKLIPGIFLGTISIIAFNLGSGISHENGLAIFAIISAIRNLIGYGKILLKDHLRNLSSKGLLYLSSM
jgi:hypothetical protein